MANYFLIKRAVDLGWVYYTGRKRPWPSEPKWSTSAREALLYESREEAAQVLMLKNEVTYGLGEGLFIIEEVIELILV